MRLALYGLDILVDILVRFLVVSSSMIEYITYLQIK